MSSDRLFNKVRILKIRLHLEEDSPFQMVHLVSQRIFKMCCWRIWNSISGKCLSLSLEITFQRIIENKLTSLLNVKLSCIKIKCCIWSKQKTYSYRSKYTYWTDVFRNSTKIGGLDSRLLKLSIRDRSEPYGTYRLCTRLCRPGNIVISSWIRK